MNSNQGNYTSEMYLVFTLLQMQLFHRSHENHVTTLITYQHSYNIPV